MYNLKLTKEEYIALSMALEDYKSIEIGHIYERRLNYGLSSVLEKMKDCYSFDDEGDI